MITRIKTLSIAIVVLLAGAMLASVGVLVNNHRYNASITTQVAPSDALITIDGKDVKAGRRLVHSGSHTVTFSRIGFALITKQVSVAKGQNYYAGAALEPTESQYMNWYANHPSDERLLESISSQTFDQNSSLTLAANDWLKVLPYINLQPYYQISYGNSKKYPNNPTKFAVYIYANTTVAKNDAIDWLSSHGANINSLEIIYSSNALQQ